MPGAKSVLIVGGGVVGLCSAYYLLERGHRVTVLERGPRDHEGCSLGNAGMIVPSHFTPLAAPGMVGMGLRMMRDPESPFALPLRPDPALIGWAWRFCRSCTPAHVARSETLLRDMNLASRACYESLAETFGEFGLTKRGLLMLCKTPHALEEEARVAARARELGLEAHVLSPAEAAALDPAITMDIAGAVHFAQDAHLTPGRFLAEMTRALEAGGPCLRWSTPVLGFQADGRRIRAVRTAEGELTADEVVIAGGSWSGEMARSLGLRLPLQAGKGYSLTLAEPRQMPALCSILTEARVAVTPMGGALRFAGTMEITGLDLSVNRARVNGILKSIPRYFPAFKPEDFRDTPVWSGLRPCSPDGLPYIGRFARYDNLSVAAGHAMMGLSLGPITGRLIAELLSGEPTSLPLEAFRPER